MGRRTVGGARSGGRRAGRDRRGSRGPDRGGRVPGAGRRSRCGCGGVGRRGRAAAAAGMVVALEFLPWTGVATFAAADDLVVATGADNATVLLDTFHWVRQPGGPDLDRLRSVPGSRVAYVQLSEPSAAVPAPEGAAIEAEAMTARRVPDAGGGGAVDFAALWAALDHIGSVPFVAAEVFNTALAAEGMAAMAAAVHDGCRSVLPG
ncbi:MAG: TIM barrel protein [Acidimicrobiales bacterium]